MLWREELVHYDPIITRAVKQQLIKLANSLENIEVHPLIQVLQEYGHTVDIIHRINKVNYQSPHLLGFIVNISSKHETGMNHWIALRQHDGHWYNLDSLARTSQERETAVYLDDINDILRGANIILAIYAFL